MLIINELRQNRVFLRRFSDDSTGHDDLGRDLGDVGTGEVVKALSVVPLHGAIDDTGDLVGRLDSAGQCGLELEGRAVEYPFLTSRAVGDLFVSVEFFHGVVRLLTDVVLTDR